MNDLLILTEIARTVNVTSANSFRHPDFNDNDFELYKFMPNMHYYIHQKEIPLKIRLKRFLYERYYNGMYYLRLRKKIIDHHQYGADPLLLYALQQANQGCGYFEDGWQITGLDGPDHFFVSNGKLTLWIKKDFHLRCNQRQADLGDNVAIRWPAGRPFLSLGYYMAFSNHPYKNNPSNTIRFYFNIQSHIATSLMSEVTRCLNEERVGFQFKICHDPQYYVRWDTAVLYFKREDYTVCRNVISTIYEKLQNGFCPQTPLFTKFLAPGLALAEEPSQAQAGESFGTHRCGLVAEGLLTAYEASQSDIESKIKYIIKSFSKEGVTVEYPYLNPGHLDIYE